MQKLQKYYGFSLELVDSVVLSEFDAYKDTFAEAISAVQKETGREYHGYISVCQFGFKKPKHFGIGPLSKRIETLTLSWTVNQDERKKNTLFFLNNKLTGNNGLLDVPRKHDFRKHQITCILDGSYVENNEMFRILIAAAVDPSVRPDRRKVSLKGTTQPTISYAAKIHNGDGRKTTLIDYYLNASVQLLLDFAPART